MNTYDIIPDVEDGLTLEDVASMKKKLKDLEKKVKQNQKPKTITISSKSHNVIKNYCKIFNLNIGDWTEKILLQEIKSNDCIIKDGLTYEEVQEKEIETISKKYSKTVLLNLYKFNKLILHKDFQYKGVSVIDGYNIYNYIGKDFSNMEETLTYEGVDFSKATLREVNLVSLESGISDVVILSASV